jgi:iron(III) transport system permease protein
VILFSLAASPYTYLLSFQAFRSEPKDLREASELMGLNSREFFRKVRWPLAFPLLVSGFFVVLAEFISDFGAVQLFGLRTFSTAIYSLWTAYLSFGTAALVSLLLVLGVAVVLWFQSRVRSVSFSSRPVKRVRPGYAWLLTLAAMVFTFFSFIGPIFWLASWAFAPADLWTRLIATGRIVANTAFLSSAFAIGLSGLVSMAVFVLRRQERFLPSLIQFGYAMPGTILAVAVTVPFYFLQRGLEGFSLSVPFAIGMMFLAWSVRLMKVAWEPISKNRAQIPPVLEEAASIYEPRFFRRWRNLLFPMLRTGVLSSVLFLFLEAAKELPIALLTRPLGWETLSIKVFEYTAESDWQKAATPSLLIVALGSVGLAVLMRSVEADA